MAEAEDANYPCSSFMPRLNTNPGNTEQMQSGSGNGSGNLCRYMNQVLLEANPVLQSSDFAEILKHLRVENEQMIRSQGYIVLAYFCTSDEFFKDVVSQHGLDVMFQVLKSQSPRDQGLLFFKALLALVLTNNNLYLGHASELSRCISSYVKLINSTSNGQESSQKKHNIAFHGLPEELKKMTHIVCTRVLPCSEMMPISEVDIRLICFVALKNLGSKQVVLMNSNFFLHIIGDVTESFHHLVMLPTFCAMTTMYEKDFRYQFHVESAMFCMDFMANAVSSSLELRKCLFLHNNKAFIKCMNRLLGFTLNALFSSLSLDVESIDNVVLNRVPTVIPKLECLHLNCLQHVLKLLVNFFRHSDDIRYAVPVSLVEKLLFCFMQICYRNMYNKFELTFMTLELMVNTVLLNMIQRDDFAKLCLMKVHIGNVAHRAIEVMIKVLSPIVERIQVLREENNSQEIPSFENYLCENPVEGRIFEVAEEHMEHTFICVYVCAWISLFCDYREPFLEHVNKLLSQRTIDLASQALTQMRNFLPLLGDSGFAEVVLQRTGETFLLLKQGCVQRSQNSEGANVNA